MIVDALVKRDRAWIGGQPHPHAIVTSRSYHPGVLQVVLVDGSVQTIADTIDLTAWRAMATRAGGEIVADR